MGVFVASLVEGGGGCFFRGTFELENCLQVEICKADCGCRVH